MTLNILWTCVKAILRHIFQISYQLIMRMLKHLFFEFVASNDGRVGFPVPAESPSNDNVLVAPNNEANFLAGCAPPPPKDNHVSVVAGV